MHRVAIYCRLSEEDKDKTNPLEESESIQNQKSMLTTFAIQQEWSIYKIYSDEDYSGIDANRPEFNQLIRDAKEGRFNIVLCKTQSRFTRDMELVERYIHNKFVEWNIRFIAIVDNIDTENKGTKKARQINGLINEWFLEDLSENIKSVLTDKRKRGQYIGAFFPYGYLKNPEDKNALIIDPIASAIVKQIFNWYLIGIGITEIARKLNDEQIPNPTAYKKQQGHAFNSAKYSEMSGELWSYNTVRTILKNQMYIGNMVQGKFKHISYKNQKLIRIPEDQWIVVENTHEPIIDTDIFGKVQEKLVANFKPQKGGELSPLAGKVRCMFCGNSMHKHYAKKIPYLYCRTKAISKNGCHSIGVPYPLVERNILDELNKMIDNYKVTGYFRRALKEHKKTDQKIKDLRAQYKNLNNRLEEMDNALLNIYMDKVKGTITEDQFVKINADLIKKEKSTKDEIDTINNFIQELVEKTDKITRFSEALLNYENVQKLDRYMVDELINKIELGYNQNPKNKVIKIHWNF